jgi:hypothetical protein
MKLVLGILVLILLLPSAARAAQPTDSQRAQAESVYRLVERETGRTSKALAASPGLMSKIYEIGRCTGDVLKDVPGYREEDADPALAPHWNQARKAKSMALLTAMGTAATAIEARSLSSMARLRAALPETSWRPARDVLIKQVEAVKLWLTVGREAGTVCGLLEDWKLQGFLGFGSLAADSWGPGVLGTFTSQANRLNIAASQFRMMQTALDGRGDVPISDRRAIRLLGPRLFARADLAFGRGFDDGLISG